MMDKITCSNCNHQNNINTNKCTKCDNSLRNYAYFKNDFKEFYKLFSTDNLDLLSKLPLTDTGYDSILNSVVDIGVENLNPIPFEIDTRKLIQIAKPYARVQYDNSNKHPGYYSYYSFNNIFINRLTPHNLIPGAIVHELSHHLFNEIIEQSLMHLLNIGKSLYVESFAWYLTLQNDYFKIVNEYLSHRVQEYFLPDHFNGYSSLDQLLIDDVDLDKEKIETSLNMGHAISDDVIFVLEKYITRSLDVKREYIGYHNLDYEISPLSQQKKLDMMYTIIFTTFESICTHKRDMQPILSDMNESFIRYNI